MTYQLPVDQNNNSTDLNIFHDGNTLVVALPSAIDLSLYSILDTNLQQSPDDEIRYILLDCSKIEKLGICGIATFISLSKLIRGRLITLLILDAATSVRQQLEGLIPEVYCIDNSASQPDAHGSKHQLM